MKNQIELFEWLKKLGVDMPFDKYDCSAVIEEPVRTFSSLKERSAEIKAKYNHKFKYPQEVLTLANYPNLEKLTFERLSVS